MLVVVDSRISSSVGVCGKCVQCASQRSGHSSFVSRDPSGWWLAGAGAPDRFATKA